MTAIDNDKNWMDDDGPKRTSEVVKLKYQRLEYPCRSHAGILVRGCAAATSTSVALESKASGTSIWASRPQRRSECHTLSWHSRVHGQYTDIFEGGYSEHSLKRSGIFGSPVAHNASDCNEINASEREREDWDVVTPTAMELYSTTRNIIRSRGVS